jgi:predicted alpha/beta superfamily hydrolase
MEFIFHFLVALLWGYICSRMAENRGRDATLGAILGALFGIFAIIGYAIAGNK